MGQSRDRRGLGRTGARIVHQVPGPLDDPVSTFELATHRSCREGARSSCKLGIWVAIMIERYFHPFRRLAGPRMPWPDPEQRRAKDAPNSQFDIGRKGGMAFNIGE